MAVIPSKMHTENQSRRGGRGTGVQGQATCLSGRGSRKDVGSNKRLWCFPAKKKYCKERQKEQTVNVLQRKPTL